jgi:hypothetical protein
VIEARDGREDGEKTRRGCVKGNGFVDLDVSIFEEVQV